MELNFALEEIKEAAKQVLTEIAGHKVFSVQGEMGAGKTTFIQALCKALGVKDNMSSPTFSIINQYAAANNETIFHIDLYRLKNEEEAINAGVEDCLFSGNTCFVEWPERAPGIFPEHHLSINIFVTGTNTRKLVI